MGKIYVKDNQVACGWESIFRGVNGTLDAVPTSSDVDFVALLSSQDLTDFKPKTERQQKHYIGNIKRQISQTYDSDVKSGKGTMKGDLKHAHMIDACLGGTVVTDHTTYESFTISGGDRKSFFAFFKHGANNRGKILSGCICDELTIEGKEGEFVTFDASVQTAKMIDVVTALPFTIASAMEDVDRSAFHWKHVAIALAINGCTVTELGQNQCESFKVTFKNVTEYKHGAPSTGGQKHANYYIEKQMEVDAEIKLFPETELFWLLDSAELTYEEYETRIAVVAYTEVAQLVQYDLITDSTTGGVGKVEYNNDADTKVIVTNVSYQECGKTGYTTGGASGLAKETTYYFKVNGIEYGITTVDAQLTWAHILALINTEIDGVAYASLVNGDLRFTSLNRNSVISIADGDSAVKMFTTLTITPETAVENGLWMSYIECGFTGLTGLSDTKLTTKTSYKFKLNGVDYEITTGDTVTYAEVIALINTQIDGYGLCDIVSGDLRFMCLGPSITLADPTAGTNLYETLDGFVALEVAVSNGCSAFRSGDTIVSNRATGSGTLTADGVAGRVDLAISLNRDPTLGAASHDFITFTLSYLVASVTESIETLDAGIDPATISLKIAEQASTYAVTGETKLLSTVSPLSDLP